MSKRIKWALFVALMFGCAALADDKVKSLYKTFHLNPHTIVVTCKDGTAPKIENFNSTGSVFVTCRTDKDTD